MQIRVKGVLSKACERSMPDEAVLFFYNIVKKHCISLKKDFLQLEIIIFTVL